MAIDLAVFNKQTVTLTTQLIRQNLDIWNAASGGALTLTAGSSMGDFVESSIFAGLDQLIHRRDPYADGDLAMQELTQLMDRAVKIHGGVGPLKMTPTRLNLIGHTVQAASAVFSAQVTQGILQDYINMAAGGLATVIGKDTDLVTDLTATTATTPNLIGLQKGVRPFGDAFSSLTCWLMDGLAYNDLLTEDVLKNANHLFNIGNVNIFQDGLGRRFIVSDIPSLRDTTANTSSVLGLTSGAAQVQAEGLQMFNGGWVTGKENVYTTIQGEYEFMLGIKGAAWANTTPAANGNGLTSAPRAKDDATTPTYGRAPTSKAVTLATNWNLIYKDKKDAAGVLVKFGKK